MEKKKERNNAFSDWCSRSRQRSMEAIENHYTSRWFQEYSKYLDAEREKAKEEYSIEQLRQPVLSYEEFAERKEKEILSDKALDGDITSGQASKEVVTEKTLLRSVQERAEDDETVIWTKGDGATEKIVTKQIYEQMTDKERAAWIGIDESDVNGSIRRFNDKMGQIGIRYGNLPEMTEAFTKIWKSVEKMQVEALSGADRIRTR